jgi:Mrp family chromosome partitioning ATPase
MSTAGERGVVDWIRDTVSDDTNLTHYLHKFNLHVMVAGSEPELPYELLKSSRLDELIRRVRDRYDFVIIDTPQLLRLPDTELIARLVDGFLIVVKADETRQGRLEEALNLMTENKVFGLVFNAVTESQ